MDKTKRNRLEKEENLEDEEWQLQQQFGENEEKLKQAAEIRPELPKLLKRNQELHTELDTIQKRRGKSDIRAEEKEDMLEKEERKINKTLELQTGHISRLLSDLERAEAENEVLKGKLASLRDKLSEANEHLSGTVIELTTARNLILRHEGNCRELESENCALREQMNEVVKHRSQLDQQLQEFQQEVEARVEIWKEIIDKKDKEIEDLRATVALYQPEQKSLLQNTVSALTQAIANREQQIEKLSERLGDASDELIVSAATLEHITLNKDDTEARMLWQSLQQALSRERKLETRIKEAESDAKSRTQQVTLLRNELQQFERGELGLAEALVELRALKNDILLRDKDIECLVKTTNSLQAKLDDLTDQNLVLRVRLGLGSESEVDTKEICEQKTLERKKSDALLERIASLEAERVALKLEIREIKAMRINVDKNPSIEKLREEQIPLLQELQEEMKLLIEENESLRKGMHEILESLRTQDAANEIHIESASLERLLEALDARHIAGWYHPAMRLQAQLFASQGVANELRNQLKFERDQEKQKQMLNVQLVSKESSCVEFTSTIQPVNESTPASTTQASREIDKIGVWSENIRTQALEIGQLLSELSNTLPKLTNAVTSNNSDINLQLEDAKTENAELRFHLNKELEHSIALCAVKAASQRVSERAALRKCNYIEATCSRLRKENLTLTKRLVQIQSQFMEKNSELQQKQDLYKKEMNNLMEKFKSAVPAAQLKAVEAELSNTSNMLRQILLDQENWGPGHEKMQYLVQEVNEYKEIASKLKQETIKLKSDNILQSSEQKDQNVVQLTQRLAAAEVSESIAIQKAEYASKTCCRLRDQKSELEQHIKELENSLTAQLSTTLLNEDRIQEKKEYSFIMQFAESQNAIVQEALTGAQQQILILKGIVDSNDTELDSQRKLVAELQANSDLHATIGRMVEEILTLRLNETNAKIDTKQSQLKCSQLSYQCQNLERQLQNEREMFAQFQEYALIKERNLERKCADLCLKHRACVPLSCFGLSLKYLRSAREELYFSRKAEQELRGRTETTDASVMKYDSSSPIFDVNKLEDVKELHTHMANMKIKCMECERQVKYLSEKYKQTREKLQKVESYAHKLEDDLLQRERDWEQKLIMLELERHSAFMENKHPNIKFDMEKVCKTVQTEFQHTSEIKKQSKIDHDNTHPMDLLSNENLVTAKEGKTNFDAVTKILANESIFPQQMSSQRESAPTESKSLIAMEATITCLSEILGLKEEAVSRYRQRLQVVHHEHAHVSKALRFEISELRDNLSRSQACPVEITKLKEGKSGSAVAKLLARAHEFEDDLKVANRNVGILSGQLRCMAEEVQRWKGMASSFQASLKQFQERCVCMLPASSGERC